MPISDIEIADAIEVLSAMMEINEVGNLNYLEWEDPDKFFGGMALIKAGKAQKLEYKREKCGGIKQRKQRKKC